MVRLKWNCNQSLRGPTLLEEARGISAIGDRFVLLKAEARLDDRA
ncbi:MAG: hypothetical protein WCE82_02255 [Halobacteriota archaeon]